MNRPFRNLLIAGFLLAQAGTMAWAQVGDVVVPGAIQAVFDVDESVFFQWIYGAGTRVGSPRDHFESVLKLAIADLDRSCSLTDDQKQKLALAGRGDIKRFLDRVADAHRLYELNRHEPGGAAVIREATIPIAADYEFGIFGEGSFFAKSLTRVLTPEQAGKYRESLREKDRFRYQAKVSLILASLDARVGFTSEQHIRFRNLIMEETRPPLKAAGPLEANVVLLQIAKLPEVKVRPIFDDQQWRTMDRIFQNARRTEAALRAEGLIE